MHRGVPNWEHGIPFLGQDPSTFKFDPAWKILKDAGRSIGIFGSLQSWPVPPLGPRDFYVPDTFARDDSCHPHELSGFQRFNLENVRENGRVVRSRPGIHQAAPAAFRLWRLGLRTATIVSAGGQLTMERLDRRYAYRRPVYQGKIAFDIFVKRWTRTQPDFATFFTNHVAGLQHRYWQAQYPEDYGNGEVRLDSFFAEAIDYGMKASDRHLGRLMRMVRTHGAWLCVASSMGQEAVHKSARSPAEELKLSDVGVLARFIGFHRPFTRNLAMEPQVALEFQAQPDLEAFEEALSRFTDPMGSPLFQTSRSGRSLSVTVWSSPESVRTGQARWNSPTGETEVPLEEVGFEVLRPDSPGTAYHMPEGILLYYGAGVVPSSSREKVSTLDFAPTVLDLYGLGKRPYMKGASFAAKIASSFAVRGGAPVGALSGEAG